MSKKDKYSVENQIWFDYCTIEGCTKRIIECPKCGHYGHRAEWLDTSKIIMHSELFPNDGVCFGVDVFAAHAHFVADKDTGRHVMHRLDDQDTVIPKKFCYVSYTIKKKRLPQHVRKIIDGEND